MGAYNLLNGFEWAIPSAFTSALAKCKFEEGDVLYDHPSAYTEEWSEALKWLKFGVQIVKPLRSSSTNTTKENVFISNWNSSVEFDLIDFQNKESTRIQCRQGNLYLLLWHGNTSDLEVNLEDTIKPLMRSDVAKKLNGINLKKTTASQFIMASDLTSQLMRDKVKKIKVAIGDFADMTSFQAQDIPQLSEMNVLPTVQIIIFNSELPHYQLEEKIKSAVYSPSKNRISKKDSFRIKTHGILR